MLQGKPQNGTIREISVGENENERDECWKESAIETTTTGIGEEQEEGARGDEGEGDEGEGEEEEVVVVVE